MTDNIDERCVLFANYIIDTHATVRATAQKFDYSKSTVHKDITERLRHANPQLYGEVRKILDINKEERHIRGGLATKHKYEQISHPKPKP